MPEVPERREDEMEKEWVARARDALFPPDDLSPWRAKAWELFGYSLGGRDNQEDIARALMQIAAALREGKDVRITVEPIEPRFGE